MSFALQEEMMGLMENQSVLLDFHKHATLSTADGDDDPPRELEELGHHLDLPPEDVAFIDYIWQWIVGLLLTVNARLCHGYDTMYHALASSHPPSHVSAADDRTDADVMDGIMACTDDADDNVYDDHSDIDFLP